MEMGRQKGEGVTAAREMVFACALVVNVFALGIGSFSRADQIEVPSIKASIEAASSSSLFREGDLSRMSENTLALSLSSRMNEIYSVSALGVLTQETSGDQSTTFSNTRLSLSRRSIELSPHLALSPSVGMTLPTNAISNKEDRFQGSVGAAAALTFDPNWKWRATGLYAMGVDRNFHEYTLNADGNPNIETRLRNSIGATMPISRKLALSLQGDFVSAWTYRGFSRNRFDLSERLTWRASEALSVFASHSNAGSTLRANGRDSNIRFFDDRQSVIAAGIGYVF